MPPHLSLNELYAMRTRKQQSRVVSFDRVLELCHRRIRTVASYGGMNTFYEIPGMLIGYPLYNIFDCMDHITNSLRRTGFLVQILPPPNVCVLYISWDPKELHPEKSVLPRRPPHTIEPPRRTTPVSPPLRIMPFADQCGMGGGGSGAGGSRKLF